MLVVGLGLATGCTSSDNSSQDAAWVPFESQEGNFSVLLPNRPSYELTSNGNKHRFTSEYNQGRRALRVSYRDDFDTSIEIASRFEHIKDVLDVQGPINPVEVMLGEHPGMEATYEMDGMRISHRIFHVAGRSFQLIATAHEGDNAAAQNQRFFASFKLLEPSAQLE